MKKSTALSIFLCFCLACQVPLETRESDRINWLDFYRTSLFKDVQTQAIFPDSKTFPDCIPKRELVYILDDYYEHAAQPGFDLVTFVEKNFDPPKETLSGYTSDTSRSMRRHINELWDVLKREPDDENSLSSLIPLPEPYIVPGGRFREIYYWDSYFTMEGLKVAGENEIIDHMVNNFAHLIDSIGFIPNGNRAYYSGRSQPPFFSLMVDLSASKDRDRFVELLPAMQAEYDFWMRGSEDLNETNQAILRVAHMPDGSILNRYWDHYSTPRPESFKEDVIIANEVEDKDMMYRDLRAAAESGWDFSSRWFRDQENLSSIHVTQIVPVDLNCLLYHLEIKLAQGYNWKDDRDMANKYLRKAEDRKQTILKYLWDENSQFFCDYDLNNNISTGVLSLAGAYPLFFQIAEKYQARAVAKQLKEKFLQPGGFVTTLIDTGQQWDWPNGWAPLEWITINGLYRYGFYELGTEGSNRWLRRNRQVYKATGKMMEKYNVVDLSLDGGGGEYPLQDGFGWTNGVALALLKIQDNRRKAEAMKK